jgi:hypothetical protein
MSFSRSDVRLEFNMNPVTSMDLSNMASFDGATQSNPSCDEHSHDNQYVDNDSLIIDTYRRNYEDNYDGSQHSTANRLSAFDYKLDDDLDEIKAIEILNHEMRNKSLMSQYHEETTTYPTTKSDMRKTTTEDSNSVQTRANSTYQDSENPQSHETHGDENNQEPKKPSNSGMSEENLVKSNYKKHYQHFNVNSKLKDRYIWTKSASRSIRQMEEPVLSLEPTSTSLSKSMIRINSEITRSRTLLNDLPLRNAVKKSPYSPMLNNEKNPISVDTSKAGSNLEVVRLCLHELKWRECQDAQTVNNCDICWLASTYHEGYHSSTLTSINNGKVNKFPCMNQLLRKGPLTLALNVLRSIYTDQYDFYPRTWFLPEQFDEFRTECAYIHERQTRLNKHLTTFIVKPNDASQGEGINLIKEPKEFLQIQALSIRNRTRSYIVQEYIDNPFLIDGLKFDLRIYVVLTSLKPLEIHICDEGIILQLFSGKKLLQYSVTKGLVRFATMNYEPPDDTNLKQIFMHLTNYSLNKKNKSYVFVNGEEEKPSGLGSKRKLSKILAFLESEGHNVTKLKQAIDDLVIKTIFALLPEMKIEYSFEIPPTSVNGSSCFQVVDGFFR